MSEEELLEFVREANRLGLLPRRDDLAGDLLGLAILYGSPDPGDEE